MKTKTKVKIKSTTVSLKSYQTLRRELNKLLRRHSVLLLEGRTAELNTALKLLFSVNTKQNENVNALRFLLLEQVRFLKTQANSMRQESGEQAIKNRYAICAYQPGVQLHPVLWLPNETVIELFETVVEKVSNLIGSE
jgi:hypothetical protein